MRKNYFTSHPRWLKARYSGRCSNCGGAFGGGETIFYYPASKRILAGKCAGTASAVAERHASLDRVKCAVDRGDKPEALRVLTGLLSSSMGSLEGKNSETVSEN